MSSPEPAEAGSRAYGRLTIDTAALVANWRSCGARAPRAECGAVVKANAYGIGIENAVPALAEAGCRTFFTAQLAEAVKARGLDARASIYVLNGLLPGAGDVYAAHDLRPVLGSLDEIREWSAFCAASGWRGGAALHVDTGMARLGLRLEAAEALLAEGSLFEPCLLISHLACADTPAHPLNGRQIAAFHAVRGLFPGVPASLCNSSGLFLPDDLGFDLTRPGIALYGGNPTPDKPNPMAPVVTVEARVIAVRAVQPGESVGYGATWVSRSPARLAIVGVGYADGYLRAGSSSDDYDSALAYAGGRYCPIAGRISMDLTTIDISALPEGTIARGDWIELAGPHLPIDEVARRSGTVCYEILTSLGSRYHRIVPPGGESR
ncbi:alanine racemase [Labrys monachus]|uniref:Alanine racemase n=1 Tax=Labrys monachus TaxID=217067 RepID=A0ABU0FDZ8_9HYPH|nr:alanine racemase [Labrys monachus]MDQ0392830.1 alanine racemase [Labrys monachus]